MAALSRGQRVPFGPDLALEPGGVASGDRRIGWRDVGEVRVVGGQLVVGHRDPKQSGFASYLGSVANAEVLQQLLDDRTKVEAAVGRVRLAAVSRRRRRTRSGSDCRHGGAVRAAAGAGAARRALDRGGRGRRAAGVLIASAFGRFACEKCGLSAEQFPAEVRGGSSSTALMVAGGVGLLVLVVVLLVFLVT
jgi:hypothetical protein